MKIAIIIMVIFYFRISFCQSVYEVTPGIKENKISITIVNISESKTATNINITLSRKSESINFNSDTKTIEFISPNEEEEVTFEFDVNRNALINKKDTVEFMITDGNEIIMMKSFIFSYTPPKEFKLEQNFPNPFNPTTTIQYQLPQDSRVTLKVYDILGSEVTTLVNEDQEAGYKEVKFNATNFASGMYVYRLQTGNYISTKKMMLLR